jgi:hypothetical protein
LRREVGLPGRGASVEDRRGIESDVDDRINDMSPGVDLGRASLGLPRSSNRHAAPLFASNRLPSTSQRHCAPDRGVMPARAAEMIGDRWRCGRAGTGLELTRESTRNRRVRGLTPGAVGTALWRRNALLRCVVVLAAGVSLGLACASSSAGPPRCSVGETCTQNTSHGQACLQSCSGVDAGGCPGGNVCTFASECCSGAACTPRGVFVCCPPTGC